MFESSDTPSDRDRIRECVGCLHDDLVNLGLEFRRRNYLEVARDQADREKRWKCVFRARDNIIYRADSIWWHFQILHFARENIRETFQDFAAAIEAHDDPMGLRAYIERQFFVLDDVVFNALSMFDYLASLTNALHLDERRLTWSHLARECSTRTSLPPLLVKALLSEDRWLKRLAAYRSHLIHHERMGGEGVSSMSYMDRKVDWHVWVPRELHGKLPDVLGRVSAERVDVVDGAALLIFKALQSARTIVKCLHDTYPWQSSPWGKKSL